MWIGARRCRGGRCRFRVWAPLRSRVELKLLSPSERLVPMRRFPRGYWAVSVPDVPPGALYVYRLDGREDFPDPASRDQPRGVHGPSRVAEHGSFAWNDRDWRGLPLDRLVFYELHVGAFTPEGTFDAIVPRLDDLAALGVTAVEIMPVAEFPGSRNWGYDGVYPFAVHAGYGGIDGLKRLVDACHARGLAAFLDVVYNHLGPEGSYLGRFGPYFTPRYKTPWGDAVNFDGEWSDGVRDYFTENAMMWLRDFRLDGLRLDAVHGIYDLSASPFLRQLSERVRRFRESRGRTAWLVAESDLNDPRVIDPPSRGGFGLDAQWSDDFHHALHALLTGEREGYYSDFGAVADMARAFRDGYVVSGRYSPFRKRHYGASSRDRPGRRFVVFAQNHDQVGGRMTGDRLASLVSFESLKLAAATVIFSPNLPLFFMGEEYGEEAPFLYFTDHSDADLVRAIRDGRKEEFKHFHWAEEPADAQDPRTLDRSRPAWSERSRGRHALLADFYARCLDLRRGIPALEALRKDEVEAVPREEGASRILTVVRRDGASRAALILNFGEGEDDGGLPAADGRWRKVLDSADARWGGPGGPAPDEAAAGDRFRVAPRSAVLYEIEAGPEGF